MASYRVSTTDNWCILLKLNSFVSLHVQNQVHEFWSKDFDRMSQSSGTVFRDVEPTRKADLLSSCPLYAQVVITAAVTAMRGCPRNHMTITQLSRQQVTEQIVSTSGGLISMDQYHSIPAMLTIIVHHNKCR